MQHLRAGKLCGDSILIILQLAPTTQTQINLRAVAILNRFFMTEVKVRMSQGPALYLALPLLKP